MPEPFPHESERVSFIPLAPRRMEDLWPVLRQAGFLEKNQFLWLGRTDEVANWQADSYGTVYLYFEGQEVYVDEEDETDPEEELWWDRCDLQYLMLSLPEKFIDLFAEAAGQVAHGLQLPLLYQEQPLSVPDLKAKLHSYCPMLEKEYGGVGSKTIRMFVELHYGRL